MASERDAIVRTAPFGAWSSPIDARIVARASLHLSEPRFGEDGDVWWLEGRPAEEGRTVLVRRRGDAAAEEVTPAGFDVRSRVHEYGGGAWLLHDGAVFFSNLADQRLYRQRPGDQPVPITPEPPETGCLRYADGRMTPDGGWLICVRESHAGTEVVNDLVAVPADGSGEPVPVASGRDFYSSPRVSPDGSLLAWLCWQHPNMPWDGTELWVSPIGEPAAARRVAGGPRESIFQPEWGPDGRLHFVSDRTGWWNLYCDDGGVVAEARTAEEAELGCPQWLFGGSTYAFLADGAIACIRCERAQERLCVLPPGSARPRDLGLPYTSFGFPALHARAHEVTFVAASPDAEPAILRLDVRSRDVTVVQSAAEEHIDAAYSPPPRAIEFRSEGGEVGHAFYYPPTNPAWRGPPDERPPLIVQAHGGPTSHAPPELARATAYWTSRGFAVVDVNYGGSSGFGRAYRERLRERWGIVDVADCVAAARHLADCGEVDPGRLVIRGGSAGGYTTLCALRLPDEFAAGASYYGVADLQTLAEHTHKFESQYLDGLVGPYPAQAQRYRDRSPINQNGNLRVPVILLQGLEDAVVPPSQAEAMLQALRANDVPHACLLFEGEQHGFRRAATIVRALEAELSFYGQVLGLAPAGDIEPVVIHRGAGVWPGRHHRS